MRFLLHIKSYFNIQKFNVNFKINTWSIAHGIKQGIFWCLPSISGKEEPKLGAACIAGKDILPTMKKKIIKLSFGG